MGSSVRWPIKTRGYKSSLVNTVSILKIDLMYQINSTYYFSKLIFDPTKIYDSLIHHFRVTDGNQKENLGILVQYKVKIKLFLGALGG